MNSSNILRTSIGLFATALAVAACDVERRDVDTGGTGKPVRDSGTHHNDDDAGHAATSSNLEPSSSNAGDAAIDVADASAFDAGLAFDAAPLDAASADAAVQEQDAGNDVVETPINGYYIIESNYGEASNVSVWGPRGQRRSSSLISSSSANPGLSAALSADVVAPTARQTSDNVVLIDRSNGVLTWVNVETGNVARQLNIAPGGYYANPQDYLQYDETTAFLTRAEPNATSSGDFDKGSDVVVIDPKAGKITDAIDLNHAMAGTSHPPYPGRLILAGGLLRVLLVGFDLASLSYADARLVTIDPESLEVTHVLVFEGIENCMNLVVAPDAKSLALACAGPFGVPEASAILQVSVEAEPRELLRLSASKLGGQQVNMIEFTSPTTLAYTTTGSVDYSTATPTILAPDTLRLLDLRSQKVDAKPVFALENAAFELGELRCSRSHGRCVLTDAKTGGGLLRQFAIDDNGRLNAIDGAGTHVLPPRFIGAF